MSIAPGPGLGLSLPHALSLLLLMIALPGSAQAGPWVKAPGDGYAKAYSAVYRTGEHQIATPTGVEFVEGTFIGSYTGIYAEAGVAPRLMLLGTLPGVFAINQDEEGERFTNGGLGDMELGLQYQLTRSVPIALRAVATLPLYSNTAIVTPGTPTVRPFLGEGQVDITGWISIGHSLYPRPIYAYVDVGYRHQSDVGPGPLNIDFKPAFVYMAQVGYAGESWLMTLGSQGQVPFSSSAGGNKTFLDVGASLFRRLSGSWWGGLEGSGDVISRFGASQAPRGQRLTLALSYGW